MLNAINDLQKLTGELHNLAFDLFLEENSEFKEYFEKSDDINIAINKDDFYACENPLVRKLYDISNSLENVKDEFNNLLPNMKIDRNWISFNGVLKGKLFKV